MKGRRDAKRATRAVEPEQLGVVDTRSGELLLVDFGNLGLWSGDRPPLIPNGFLDPRLTESMNGAIDYEIVGPDAEEAADRLDLAAVNGTHVFDVPHDAPGVTEAFLAVCTEHGLDAQLQTIDRIPHRERVRTQLERTPAGAEVPFHGIWAVAVRDLPSEVPLAVFGERMDDRGPDRGRWKSVWVQVAQGSVATSHLIGYVLVDRARLMFADPDALSSWNADDPAEGLADLVFWGRDAEVVAAHLEAETFDEGGQPIHGWRNRPTNEIRTLGAHLRAHLESTSAKVAVDYRPHDDDHRILAEMRESPCESASANIAGHAVCGFFTTWGDGAFPVYRDLDTNSQLLRIRVELGAPEIVARSRRMEELWFGSLSKLAIASPAVARGSRVRWLERDAPRNENDSGWCVYAGTESQEELDEPGAARLVPLRDLIRDQPDLEPILGASAPAAFELADDGTWQPIPPPR